MAYCLCFIILITIYDIVWTKFIIKLSIHLQKFYDIVKKHYIYIATRKFVIINEIHLKIYITCFLLFQSFYSTISRDYKDKFGMQMQREHVYESTTVVRHTTATESRIWLVGIALGCVALLFVVISIAAPGWGGYALIKDLSNTHVDTIVLSFLALFFLVLALVSTALFATRLITSFSSGIKLSVIIFFALAGIFIVAAYTSFYGYHETNYCIYLMVTAGILTFIASITVALWLGQSLVIF